MQRCRSRQEPGWGGDKEVLEQKPGQGVSGAAVMALDGLPCQIAAQWIEGEPRRGVSGQFSSVQSLSHV